MGLWPGRLLPALFISWPSMPSEVFAADGHMLTGCQKWNGTVVGPDEPGDWYFLDNTAGGPLEGAAWHERAEGAGAWEIWEVK